MKKLLCLLLALVMVLSFAACASDSDDDGESKRSKKSKETTEGGTAKSGSYEDAIELVLKLYTADLSKSDFEKMLPADVWTYLEDEEGVTVDDCYDQVAGDMDGQYEYMEEMYGKNFKVTFEVVNKEKASEEDVADFLETMEDMYGLDADDFGDAYEIQFSATVSGSEGEDTQEMEMGFVEYKGNWYAADALLEGF